MQNIACTLPSTLQDNCYQKIYSRLRVIVQIWLAIAAFAVSAITDSAAAQEIAPTGDLRLSYTYTEAGMESPYRLYVPTGYDPSRTYPLIVMLHGGGGDENAMFDQTAIRALAEARGAIVASPLGYDRNGGWGNFYPIVTTRASKAMMSGMAPVGDNTPVAPQGSPPAAAPVATGCRDRPP